MPVKRKDLPRLIKEIESIRSLVEKRNGMFRKIDFSFQLRLVVLLMGIFIILSCLLMHFLIRQYATYDAIPSIIKLAYFVATGSILLSLGFMKIYTLKESARKLDPSYRFINIIREFLVLPQFLHSCIVWLVVMITLTTVIILANQDHLLVPMLCFTIAFMINLLTGIMDQKTYLFAGYWLLICGILCFVFPSVPALIAAAISIGGGFLLFGIISYLTPRLRARKNA